MYGRLIRFAVKKNVHQSIVSQRFHSFYYVYSVPTQSNYKDRNLVDDIRESASGMPPVSSSGAVDQHVNVMKTTTTPSYPTSKRSKKDDGGTRSYSERMAKDNGDTRSYVVDSVKQGVVKAMETGLDIGEIAKKTLDNVWDATKDTTHKVKEAVAGDEDKKYDVPPTDHFVDDLRKHAPGGYDQKRNK